MYGNLTYLEAIWCFIDIVIGLDYLSLLWNQYIMNS